MPIRRPMPDVPERIAAIQSVLGSPTTLLVLRHFLARSASTRSAIAEDTGISTSAVTRALNELEERQYITTPVAPSERVGRVVRYDVARRRVLDDTAAFFAWLAE